jgi:hypothetical protein
MANFGSTGKSLPKMRRSVRSHAGHFASVGPTRHDERRVGMHVVVQRIEDWLQRDDRSAARAFLVRIAPGASMANTCAATPLPAAVGECRGREQSIGIDAGEQRCGQHRTRR